MPYIRSILRRYTWLLAFTFPASLSTRAFVANPFASTPGYCRRLFGTMEGASQPLVLSQRENLVQSEAENSNGKIQLILASQSPRRKEILDMMGLQGRFLKITSPLDEKALQDKLKREDPSEYTKTLATEKAMALAKSLENPGLPTLVLGSDTVVYADEILEKPTDIADAKDMLQKLQGKQHFVYTAVSLVRVDAAGVVALLESFVERATVSFGALSDCDISAYVDTGEPMDKAGSYGIQGFGGQFVTAIQGDFFTVMGLPMHKTSKALASAIVDIVE